jgi:single-stranded-DNA-specific exonuclease
VIPDGCSWRAAPYSYARACEIAGALGLSGTVASVLVRRGYDDLESARRFLAASETHDPFEFRDMRAAAGLLLDHVRRGSTIAVHGDYDVDGVCSTALAVTAIERLGGTAKARLPSRSEDGYGLSPRTVEDLRSRGADLLLTADCGIGAVEEVALARRLGMDVIVSDHHRPAAELPACPIVHPALCGYPCPDLCATAVVLKLCQALFELAGRDRAELDDQLDVVALATIADVVPLAGENRTLAKQGLKALAGTARPGLRALMRVAGVEPQSVREHTVGFGLAPRMNAAGRLYRADAALELLLTADDGRALEIARELDAINSERQTVETRILFEAEQQLSADEGRRADPLYVLAGEQWHPGVIGIVASRLVERYHRPCVLVALTEGHGRGSGRSISAYDLHAGLSACAGHLTRFGGHRMAAGLELDEGALEAFRHDLVEHARSLLGPRDLTPVEIVDAIVPGDALGLELADELDRLRPFGLGNPGVNLLVPAARVGDVRTMGEGRHARFTVRSAGVRTSVVAFGRGGDRLGGGPSADAESRHDLVARLEANEWQGAIAPRLVLRSLHPLGYGEGELPGCADCACRARGSAWWDAVWLELERDLAAVEERASSSAERTVVDLRGCGILGSLSELLSSGEPVAVATLDCSRRRRLVEVEVDGARFGRPAATVASARCAPSALSERLGSLAEPAFVLLDYATITRDPALLDRFVHVFALDPPPSERLLESLRATAPGDGTESFLHLGWGEAEIEFAAAALEQEHGLRAPLSAIYRSLVARPEGVEDDELESLLTGEGRHPRPPALVGRCLRVLGELGFLELERSSATVKCTIRPLQGRVELERSVAFRAFAASQREGLRFLSEQGDRKRKARAA